MATKAERVQGWMGRAVPAIAYCSSWCVVSSVLILLNNHVLHNGLPFPILLASCGQGASFIGALLLTSAGAFSLKAEIDLPFWASRCLPIGMASAGTLALGNIAYMHLSVSFIQMLKAGTPVVTMLVLFAARMEQPRRDLVLSILVITIGCALSTEGEIAFSWIGFCLMFLSELAEALKIVATQHLLTSNKVRFELHESLLYIAPAAFFWMLLSASALEIPRLVQMPYLKEQLSKNAGAVVLSGVLGFLVNLLTLGAIRSTSSLTFKVLGQGKNVAVVLGGIVFFSNRVTQLQALAYAVSIAGFFLYQRAQQDTPGSKLNTSPPTSNGTPQSSERGK